MQRAPLPCMTAFFYTRMAKEQSPGLTAQKKSMQPSSSVPWAVRHVTAPCKLTQAKAVGCPFYQH